MDRGSADPFAGLKEASEEYTVYDSHYEKIGKVDDLIVDEEDRVLYVGVKTGGFLGSNSTLVPADIIRINDRRRLIEVSEPADTVRHAPHFGASEDLTPELDNHVRSYFGLESLRPSPEHEPREGTSPAALGPDELVDLEPGERATEQDRSFPLSESGSLREERPRERMDESPRERTGTQEPISEPLGDGPRSFWERLTSSGVTVHRLRR